MAMKKNEARDLLNWKVQELVFRAEGAETGDFITYDADKCNGCGECALVCAASLWSLPGNGAQARLSSKYRENCLECAACYAVCEPDAIDFRYPNGGSGIVIQHG